METSFYTEAELRSIPFQRLGKHVLISRKCSLYSPETIALGDHVRIDDFCILSGTLVIGSYVHISAYTAMYAKYGIVLEDFTTISARVLVFSQNDDYSGNYLTNSMIPEHLRKVAGGQVTLKKFAIVGAGSMILPGVTIQTGGAVGAMSLVTRDVDEWSLYTGIPAAFKKTRSREMLKLAEVLE
jgi:galactoside O-acetyltransferase